MLGYTSHFITKLWTEYKHQNSLKLAPQGKQLNDIPHRLLVLPFFLLDPANIPAVVALLQPGELTVNRVGRTIWKKCVHTFPLDLTVGSQIG